jgi:dTDP-4-dehydrorhamnose reductase
LELWGGHECTVNRVGDRFRDQTRLTGHHDRIEDLALFASLGIKRLRYPVLWERIAPDQPEERDWRWTDERLAEIHRLGMQPIAGLVHHGSGPRYTSLVSDNFAPLLAAQAGATAERYPHLTDWTPVNEPLTTARFSTLYSHWYPHARDERLFWLAFLNQIEGTIAAMAAIRRVNPAARLVQTEDLGEFYGTEQLSEETAFRNQRRWATWDLLSGRVLPGHPLWPQLDALGFGDRLRELADHPCPPDIIGVNYYATSDRCLDHRLELYPFEVPPEGFHDLTAARVIVPAAKGLPDLLRQAWDRYGLPLAVTESHLSCTREEQLRWIWHSWQSCLKLVQEGVEVRALTAWALLGAVDWDTLLCVDGGHYELGAFDISGGKPRPTAIASLLGSLGTGAPLTPAVAAMAQGAGWWQRDMRLEHGPVVWAEARDAGPGSASARPIVITGATGTLGRALAGGCDLRGIPYLLTDRTTLPIDEPGKVARFLDEHDPWAVINAAGWVRVDDAEAEQDGCFLANSRGAAILAEACATRGVHCTLFSSDLVFDGRQDRPYVETDRPEPLNTYGLSKLRAEALARDLPGVLVIRTAAFFSPYDQHNFAIAVERTLRDGYHFHASDEHVVTPTYVPDLVRTCLDLVIDQGSGIWHVTNGRPVSWLAFGRMIAAALDLDPRNVKLAGADELGWRAERPRYAALASVRGMTLPSLDDAVSRHVAVRRAALPRAPGPEIREVSPAK